MNQATKKALIGVVMAVVLLAVAVVAWAVISREPATHEGTDAHTAVHDPLGEDPALAATSAIAALMTWQPATQASPQESAVAITGRLTGQLAHYATSREPDPVLPELWQDWKEAGDTVHAVATVNDGGVRLDGESRATVEVVVEQEVWHPSGKTTPYSRFAASVDVEQVDGQWKAARYEITGIDY